MTRKPGGLPPMNQLVESRVDRLLSEARAMHAQDGKLAARYVELALALASRHRFRLGNARRHLYCAKCHVPWIVGRTVTVRRMAREKMSQYTCACGHARKFSYSKAKKAPKLRRGAGRAGFSGARPPKAISP